MYARIPKLTSSTANRDENWKGNLGKESYDLNQKPCQSLILSCYDQNQDINYLDLLCKGKRDQHHQKLMEA